MWDYPRNIMFEKLSPTPNSYPFRRQNYLLIFEYYSLIIR